MASLFSDEDLDWHREARCLNMKPEIFFGDENRKKNRPALTRPEVRRAKAICHDCPVLGKCLLYAIFNEEPYGVWGGHTERERDELRQALLGTS